MFGTVWLQVALELNNNTSPLSTSKPKDLLWTCLWCSKQDYSLRGLEEGNSKKSSWIARNISFCYCGGDCNCPVCYWFALVRACKALGWGWQCPCNSANNAPVGDCNQHKATISRDKQSSPKCLIFSSELILRMSFTKVLPSWIFFPLISVGKNWLCNYS